MSTSRVILLVLFYLLFVATILNVYIYILTDRDSQKPYPKVLIPINYTGLIINTTGCKIPDPLPNPSFYKFYNDAEPLSCGLPPLIKSNLTSIYIAESSLEAYNIKNMNEMYCCYNPFKRMPPELHRGKPDFNALYDKECIIFRDSVDISQEFIVVKCFHKKYRGNNNPLIYTEYISFVPSPNNTKSNIFKEEVNILIMGIDSVSRINFHRQMPETASLLESLQAVEMLGYNKVGENSLPNLIPLLTGNKYGELLEGCLKHGKFYDNCTFLWDKYKDIGYVTAFAEDQAVYGLFYSNDSGFIKQPTDYYWHTFSLESFLKNRSNTCFGTTPAYKILLKYIMHFLDRMRTSHRHYFGYFWESTLTHDYLNHGQIWDNEYAQLITYLENEGFLSNAVLIVMSDHGQRLHELRYTFQGMFEDRLPFMFIKLPDWLKKRFPYLQENLKMNAQRLITVHDLHETLLQLVDVSKLSAESSNIGIKRGYSLFAPITENRTCETAQIPAHFCTCQFSDPVSITNDVVIEAAHFILFHLNNMLREFPQCKPLTLKLIVYARKTNHEFSLYDSGVYFYDDYTVLIQANPSDAMLEATVRKKLTDKFTMSLSGSVERVNRYHEQSLCVNNNIIKMYCYC